MKFRLNENILLEGKNIEKTWEQYREKLMKWESGFHEDEGDARDVFYQILESDPTYKEGSNTTGDYAIWLLNQYLKSSIFRDEGMLSPEAIFTDREVNGELLEVPIKDVLKEFIKKKSQLEKKDINQYKTTKELIDALNNTDFSDRQKDRQKRRTYEGAKQVFNGEDWEIWIPETYEASCTLGAGSGWCTADTRTRKHYDHYLKRGGKYYIIINKHNPKEKYQFHWESNQYMGSASNPGHTSDKEYPIDKEKFLLDNPEVRDFFEQEGYLENWGKNIYYWDGVQKVPMGVVNVVINDGVTKIGKEAFIERVLLKSIDIPESVTEIGSVAFCYCTSLQSITIPNSVTKIGFMAFYGCTSLESVNIPESVAEIDTFAFRGCTSLIWEQYKDKIINLIKSKDIFKNDVDEDKYRQYWLATILSCDPTYQEGTNIIGDYGVWLTNMWLKTGKRLEKDYARALLTEFESKQPNLKQQDINQYSSYEELETALKETSLSKSN